ncbi:TonB-dependent receptor plug domain-containing protein [Aestuariibaculum lutulentum]|uniref:TonB-dependent receptor plug domain-containing protein n=1 Tax=Aestuariibaculum lutulentum TaxID=2920935 RepID=A0ABS9RGQ9_9FLAO|nr:TonB-dependent receptor [Aestuariibaculum lutulentum]MCH4552133.1 TonB-dependent receptor plug domain-containing protein [Aestuariibaculum lutulentum]
MKYKLTIAFLLVSFTMLSQEKASVNYLNTPVVQVLLDFESKFNVKFSYNAKLIGEQLISLEAKQATLDELLFDIEALVDIKFTKETERYYTVQKIKNRSITDTQHLEKVVVKEYITSGISENNDDTSIILSPEKLGILPGLTEPDVLQSIQLLPGVQSPTETASGLFIRGGTPDQNLVLWDGIKMYNSGHFFGTISALNPYITQDIKLYKNGTKARYGNRISAVIDITSDEDIPDKLTGSTGFNMTHTDGNLKVPLSNKAAIMISGRRSIADIVDTETFRNLSKRVFQETKISEGNKVFEDDEVTTTKDLFFFNDFTVKAIVKPNENNTFLVSNLFTKNKLDYGFLIEDYDEASQDKLDIKNQGSSIKWNHGYSDDFNHEFSAYYSNYDFDYTGTNSITNEFNDRLNKQNRVEDLGFAFDTNYNLDEASTLGFGYQFSSNKVKYLLNFEDSESPEDNYNESNVNTNNNHGIYGDYKYYVLDKWLLNFGVRANYFSVVDKLFFEPRFQLETKLFSNLKFKSSVENLHQSVSEVIEFNTQDFGLENQIWVLSDGDEIPVLRSFQVTSGFVFDKAGWHLDVEGYYKDIDGLTSFTLGFDNIDDFFSKGKSKVFGLDVLIKKKIQNYRTWLSYSVMDNNFTFNTINNGEAFPGNSDITHHLTWSLTYEWKHFDVSLGWTMRTGIPYTKANGLIETSGDPVIDFEATNGARLPNYHKLDVSATYAFNFSRSERWKGKLGVSFLNVYNQKNVLSRKYEIAKSTEDDGFVLREINKNSLGFTPNLVFRIDF